MNKDMAHGSTEAMKLCWKVEEVSVQVVAYSAA